jgi:hypothetical protein
MSTQTHPPRARRFHRLAIMALVTAILSLAGAVPAMAYASVDIVHTERVQAGPYTVTVGFSTWPIRAMKSLDFTFAPDGGIADKKGALMMTGPAIPSDQQLSPLVRHPRKRDVWGLDVQALDAPGSYTIGFRITGPKGVGQGMLPNVPVLSQPGPPLPLSWTVALIPLLVLVLFIGISWRRSRPGLQPFPL